MKEINNRIITLCKMAKENNEPNFYKSIAKTISNEFGVLYTPESIRGISRRYREIYELDENFKPINPDSSVTVQINADNTTVSERKIVFKKDEPINSESLLEKHGYNKDKFVLVNARNSKWSMNGNTECYSSRITVKPKQEFVWSQDTIDKIFENIKVPKCLDKYNQTNYEKNGKALVLPIVDLHYALKATSEACDSRYNEKTAKSSFLYVVMDVLDRIKDKKFEKIFFTIGNDMLNCDNKSGTTTKGTPQDNCIDVEKAIIEVSDMLIYAIDLLKKVSDVDVIHVPSNHDYIVSFGIANAMRLRYVEDEHVSVDCSYIERKYRKFGNTLMGFAHDIKTSNVNDIVNQDVRHLISDTTATVYFLAHLHHEECVDVHGTDVRRLPTISANSRWAYNNGYKSVRKCQSFIIDSEYGITDVIYSIIG